MRYLVCGISVHLLGHNRYAEQRMMSYRIDEDLECRHELSSDMIISMDIREHIPLPEGEYVMDGETKIMKRSYPDDGYFMFSIANGSVDMVLAMVACNETWDKICISVVPSDALMDNVDLGKPVRWTDYNLFILSGIAFRNLLIRKEGICIHSSAIEYKGKGFIFSAASGTGKSTHARLWKEHYGNDVTIINDDRPAIRFINDEPLLYGLPWSGSTDVFINRCVPLNGIIMLERSGTNSIERISAAQALPLLLPRCFLPYYDAAMMEKAMSVIERLVEKVPIYRLKCKPDIEAVEVAMLCTR